MTLAAQPKVVRPGDSLGNPIRVEDDDVEESSAGLQATPAGSQPAETAAPSVEKERVLTGPLHQYKEVTERLKANDWAEGEAQELRNVLAKLGRFWPGRYSWVAQRWYLHKENPSRFICRNRLTGDYQWTWQLLHEINEEEKANKRALAGPINGVAPVKDKKRKTSRTSVSNAGSKPAAKQAETMTQSLPSQSTSEATPVPAAPKRTQGRKPSARVSKPKVPKPKVTKPVAPKRGRKSQAAGKKETSRLRALLEEDREPPQGQMGASNGEEGALLETLPVEDANFSESELAAKMEAELEMDTAEEDDAPVETLSAEDARLNYLFEEEEEPLQDQMHASTEEDGALLETLPVEDANFSESELAATMEAELEMDTETDTEPDLDGDLEAALEAALLQPIEEDGGESLQDPETDVSADSDDKSMVSEEALQDPTMDVSPDSDDESEISEEE
ncbi:hypothetical protein IWX50DRAFT_628019 [Phyllosticta citricarpa]